MYAILSDVHGNLEALRAVLDEIDRLGVRVVYNLGDMTGYGPSSVECIELSMHMAVVLRGNFDQAVLTTPEAFGSVAERSVVWTRQVLDSLGGSGGRGQRCKEFLASLEPYRREAEILYVHGSPRNTLNEYVFPEDILNTAKMVRIGDAFEHVCFNGHTHMPGIFVEDGPRQWQFRNPGDCGNVFRLDGRKVLCNVGSVGQPWDGDWRAGFVLFDGSVIQFHRIEYDIETTIKKIYAEPNLDNLCGDRLRDGR